MASTPLTMLRQNVAASGAPGKTAPIPTIAMPPIGRPPARPHPSAISFSNASTPCDGSISGMPRRAYSSASPTAMPAPAQGPQSTATTRRWAAPEPRHAVQRVVRGRVVGLAAVAEDSADAAEQHQEAVASKALAPFTFVAHTRSNDSCVLAAISLSSSTPAPWMTPSSRPNLRPDVVEHLRDGFGVGDVALVVADRGGLGAQAGPWSAALRVRRGPCGPWPARPSSRPVRTAPSRARVRSWPP